MDRPKNVRGNEEMHTACLLEDRKRKDYLGCEGIRMGGSQKYGV
jgi:hypothetical protein